MALIVRCPKCGETKEHPETIVGHTLQCPGCDARFTVAKAPGRGNVAVVVSGAVRVGPRFKTSGLAAAALAAGMAAVFAVGVCGVLVGLTGGAVAGLLGGAVGLVLGIVGLGKIGGDPQLKGRGLAIGGIAMSATGIVLGLVLILFGETIWYAITEPPDEATQRIFVALDAALGRYYDDWKKFPWTADTSDGLMGEVDARKGLRPAKGAADDAAAVLFAALNLRMQRGPYVPNAGMRILEKNSGGASYRVYCDGWGRLIHYDLPPRGVKKPLLESDGQDPDDPDDNLTNE
ncbi:MAG: hypothetical protein IMZ44_06710 [Planctomycetes bacterium]|nr:hypothetical protein [Planctomycetota bacterium]